MFSRQRHRRLLSYQKVKVWVVNLCVAIFGCQRISDFVEWKFGGTIMMLSEREPFPNFHECFYNSIETRRTFSLFYLENAATEKEGDKLFTLIIKMKILFARAIITSTTRDSSLFLSSFSINLLAFCHECPFLIGFATHYLFSK